MNITKSELRQTLKSSRLELSDLERTLMSRSINRQLRSIFDWSRVTTLHYFEPIKELMEPDISDLITYVEDNFSDIKLFTPRNINKKWEIVAVKGGEIPDNFDVIIVPTLGFDKKLNRIGYGSGFYDRFLATQKEAKKIGVCYEMGRIDAGIPIEEHDIALDTIVTDKNVY